MQIQLNDYHKRLDELSNLEAGWDGHKGLPLRSDVKQVVLELLNHPLFLYSPFDIIPDPNGGVQVEYHEGVLKIELHIEKPCSFFLNKEGYKLEKEPEIISLTDENTNVYLSILIIEKWIRDWNIHLFNSECV
jgi:hypothetical protein